MNVGKLNRKIIIQSPPTSKDNGGELTGSRVTYITTWAKVTDKSSGENMVEGTQPMTTTRIFTIRYRTGITNDMRVSYNSQYWKITGMMEIGRKEYIDIQTILKTNW